VEVIPALREIFRLGGPHKIGLTRNEMDWGSKVSRNSVGEFAMA